MRGAPAVDPAPAPYPAPESVQGLLRLAAQLEALADAPAQTRRGPAARAILPPAPKANYTLSGVEVDGVPAKVPFATLPAPLWQAAAPVFVLLPVLLLACVVVLWLAQRQRAPSPHVDRDPRPARDARELKAVASCDGPDRELVLELVLSQAGPNAPHLRLLQRARQLSRRRAATPRLSPYRPPPRPPHS